MMNFTTNAEKFSVYASDSRRKSTRTIARAVESSPDNQEPESKLQAEVDRKHLGVVIVNGRRRPATARYAHCGHARASIRYGRLQRWRW